MDSRDRSLHPCFDRESAGTCGRAHLPVAPRCNIQCNYCNRKYDCVNESRPGVSSAVLSPEQAMRYTERVIEREPRIRVAGIAGPGDPLANPAETLSTLRLLKERFPQLLFCLASNGLGLPAHVDELAELGATHVTVTVNAVDPAIGARLVAWVRDGKVVYRGRQAAELLLSRQIEAIRCLKARGIAVKVNTVLVPGVNDGHAAEIAAAVGALGADIMNLMPVRPVADTPFSGIAEPDPAAIEALRAECEPHVVQMRHCKRCRADAVGLLCADLSAELGGELRRCARTLPESLERPYVAVATREGMLVNQHLGEAYRLQIWARDGSGFKLVEERAAPEPGCGPRRW